MSDKSGFWYTDEDGETCHILGDPDMDKEAFEAIKKMIASVKRKLSGSEPVGESKLEAFRRELGIED